MARPEKLNIVSAFTWLSNSIDTQMLTSSEQLVLLHLVKFLNRNFWQAVTLSYHMLAKAIGKDDRTVKAALKKLSDKGLVVQKGGQLHIGIKGHEKYFSDTTKSESPNIERNSDVGKSEVDGRIKTLADYLG